MARKKWTPQIETTDTLLKLREKRKWQLSYRRYVVEQKPSTSYAPYFGLDIKMLREWFELQFQEGICWENYGKTWQIEHIVPAGWFDFSIESDLKLCWSFINMRIQRTDIPDNNATLLGTKKYFEALYVQTNYPKCKEILTKLTTLESNKEQPSKSQLAFISAALPKLNQLEQLSSLGFSQLNQGMPLEKILLEMDILRKFG